MIKVTAVVAAENCDCGECSGLEIRLVHLEAEEFTVSAVDKASEVWAKENGYTDHYVWTEIAIRGHIEISSENVLLF